MKLEKRVIIIDDDQYVLQSICELLEENSIIPKGFSDPIEALQHLKENPDYLTVISDVKMKQMDGLDLLKNINLLDPNLPVIIITGYSDVDMVVRALRENAYDFITKPIKSDYFMWSINRAIEKYSLVIQNRVLKDEIRVKDENYQQIREKLVELEDSSFSFEGLIYKSHKMEKIVQLIKSSSNTGASILITGETGTGKDMVAKAIHSSSKRKDSNLVSINCGAIPDNLVESEFFGYEAGAFTGAIKKNIGKFEYANGGTIFLDEIGDIPLHLQVKLLRVIEDKVIVRLGSNSPIKVDVRIIAATSKNLEELVSLGKFREDLFFRLGTIPIHLPPLRERREDIIWLTIHFVNKYNVLHNKSITSISDNIYSYLMHNQWKGNIRELDHFLERCIVLTNGEILEYPDNLEKKIDLSTGINEIKNDCKPFKILVEAFEKQVILDSLKKNKSNVSKTAKELKIEKKTLYRKMQRYNLNRIN